MLNDTNIFAIAFLCFDDKPYHTYGTFGLGLDQIITTNHPLDQTAFGRMEQWEQPPRGWPKHPPGEGIRIKHHYKYGDLTKGCSA